jgi:hypothetical protein
MKVPEKETLIGILRNPDELERFTESIIEATGVSRLAVLEAIQSMLVNQQRKRNDDLAEVYTIGCVINTVWAAIDGLRDSADV